MRVYLGLELLLLATLLTTCAAKAQNANANANAQANANVNVNIQGGGAGCTPVGTVRDTLLGQSCSEFRSDTALCADPRVDAVFIRCTTCCFIYVFKGDEFWTLNADGILISSEPESVQRRWAGIPAAAGGVDAAYFDQHNKRTYLFKGDRYWKYNQDNALMAGFPKNVTSDLRGVPGGLDAVLTHDFENNNRFVYFIKGSQYWRRQSNLVQSAHDEGPKDLLKNWGANHPVGVNAAFSNSDGNTYFFKDDKYYRYVHREKKMSVGGSPPFPRLTKNWWFGCEMTKH